MAECKKFVSYKTFPLIGNCEIMKNMGCCLVIYSSSFLRIGSVSVSGFYRLNDIVSLFVTDPDGGM